VIIAADPNRVEADLHAGKLACPACGGRLRGWSHARTRRVRQLAGPDLLVRPRRARCRTCARTQVILPASCLPRRADATEVVGKALHAKAIGWGHRRIAVDLGRSASTVRRWLRAARGAHTRWLRQRAISVVSAFEPDVLNRVELNPDIPGDRPLLEALTVLGAAVAVIRARTPTPPLAAWTLIGAITAGRLLLPEPAD
jgi:hypothetical protein